MEPFGYYENDIQNSYNRLVAYQAAGVKQNDKPFTFKDLDKVSLASLRDPKKQKEQSVEEQKQLLLSFASSHNKSIRKVDKNRLPVSKQRNK